MTNEEYQKLYEKEFPEGMTFKQVSDKLDDMEQHPQYCKLLVMYCDSLVSAFSDGHIKYDEKVIDVKSNDMCQLLFHNIEKLEKDSYFYWAFYYFLKKNKKKCLDFIRKLLMSFRKQEKAVDEVEILELFLIPYKNAFKGFWEFVSEEIKTVPTVPGIPEFCDLILFYYKSKSNEEVVDSLAEFMRKYPSFATPKEWLGYTYYNMAMWNNAIAYFERIETPVFFYQDSIYWMTAWSYGKVKNYVKEEQYYRKCLELFPEGEYTLNNLGYSLYKQKKYIEAKEIFEQCIREQKDLSCAGNNYVRVLIALGRNADAKNFVRQSDVKVSKVLRGKVDKLDDHNKRIKKDDISVVKDDNEHTEQEVVIDLGVRRQQFSNEKLLEDELTARIEAGIPVFGLNLRVYRRKGEYGRQYNIPIGRLDLLCEDDKENLYVIELKKDSGYGDAYQQTSDYLDWFAKSEKFKDKKIYGIICLNQPTEELLQKVHADKRMKLYEYQISYTER